jgi:hypothetical protein
MHTLKGYVKKVSFSWFFKVFQEFLGEEMASYLSFAGVLWLR